MNLSNDSSDIEGAKRIALRDPNVEGHPVLAVLDVENIELVSDQQIDIMNAQLFGTLDSKHPDVALFRNLGKLKSGDSPASVRDACIRKMVDVYFPENPPLVNGYGFDMLYAGVGDYYDPFDARAIFDELAEGAMEIQIFAANHSARDLPRLSISLMPNIGIE